LLCAGAAHAQAVSTLIEPVVPVDFDRGRNINVAKQVDPHFVPIGIPVSGFDVFPSIALESGATDNVYVNNQQKVGDALFTLKPRVEVRSHWSRHSLSLVASSDVVRYAHETLRNREEYSILSTGLLEASSEIAVKARVAYDRRSESPYVSDLAADVSVLSQYSRFNPTLSVSYTAGRSRLTATVEHYAFRFNTIQFADGTSRDQSERNRDIERGAIQGDYAFTPSVAAYLQLNADHTNYLSARSDGSANRDGNTVRVIGGLALDLAGLLRGRVGVGYVKKSYDAARYDDVQGLAIESNVEMFLSPLTTLTLAAKSSFQDVNSNVNNGAYRDVTVSAGVDHALLRNLLLSAKASRIKRSALESNDNLGQSIVQLSFDGQYQADRFTTLTLGVAYGRGRPTDNSGSIPFDELSGRLSVQLRL
jgi:hypothetical protein